MMARQMKFRIAGILVAAMTLGVSASAPAVAPGGGQVDVNIPVLPPGKSITITWDATVTSPLPTTATELNQQATVSGSNFSSVSTDDPDTGAAGDATITKLYQGPNVIAQNFTVSADSVCEGAAAAANFDNGTTDPDGGMVSLSISPSGPYSLGDTTITLTGTDDEGDMNSSMATLTVEDTTDPSVTAKDILVGLDSGGNATITPSDVFGSGADNCGTVNPDTVVPNTFGVADIGDKTVTLTVNDGNGNTNTDMSTVTVLGRTPSGVAFYTVSSGDNKLRTVNPNTGATISEVAMTIPGGTIDWANGIAADPATGEPFALVQTSLSVTPHLVRILPPTGACALVGVTGITDLKALAFSSDGRLFAIDPSGSEDLYEINPTTGAPTLAATNIGDGTPGDSLAYNPSDGLLYYTSGDTAGSRSLKKIDLSGPTVTSVSSDTMTGSLNGMVFESTNGYFLAVSSVSPMLYRVLPGSGATLALGGLDHAASGVAFTTFVPVDLTDFQID